MRWRGRRSVGPSAERAAHAAVLADSEDPWVHFALAGVHLFARRFDDSLAEFALALQLNPNFALAQGYYGLTLAHCGRWEEAVAATQSALRLSPRDPFLAIYWHGRLRAVHRPQLRGSDAAGARRAAPARRLVDAHRVLAAAAGVAGERDIAAAALTELRGAQPNVSSPGSKVTCRSGRRRSSSNMWKAFAVRN